LEAEEEEEAAAAALFESSTPTVVVDEEAGIWYPYYFTLPGMLEEEVPNVEDLPTVSALAASSASAAYNTLPSMLEEEVPDVQILPTIAPAAPTVTLAAPTVTSAAPTALAAYFAQEAPPTLPPNQAIHNVKHTVRASGGASTNHTYQQALPISPPNEAIYNVKYTIKYTVLALGGATKPTFLLAYLHKL